MHFTFVNLYYNSRSKRIRFVDNNNLKYFTKYSKQNGLVDNKENVKVNALEYRTILDVMLNYGVFLMIFI